MPANTTPIFALTPQLDWARITGTTTDKSGGTTANLVTLVSATTFGTKVTQIGFKFVGTSTAGTLLIFISDTDGTTLRLFDEILITIAPFIVGGIDAITFVQGKGFDKITKSPKLRLNSIKRLENYLVLHYTKV